MSMNTQGETIGEILRAAREKKKLSIEQVHRETRISVQTIRALEQDDFGALPSETYLKGFLRTYAEFLGLDGGKLWAMMGQRSSASGSGSGPSWEIEESFRAEKLGPPRIIKRLILPILIVLVVILIVMLAREKQKSGSRIGGARSVEDARAAG